MSGPEKPPRSSVPLAPILIACSILALFTATFALIARYAGASAAPPERAADAAPR